LFVNFFENSIIMIMIVYLDEKILAIKGVEAKIESRKVRQKSLLEPSHSVEWLGFHTDLAVGKFSVKINVLKSKLLDQTLTGSIFGQGLCS